MVSPFGLTDFPKSLRKSPPTSANALLKGEFGEVKSLFEEQESTKSTISFIDDTFTNLQAAIYATVIHESLNKLKILGLIGGLPRVNTTLDTATVIEKLEKEDTQSFIFDPDTLEPFEGSIKKQMLIKFQKDRSIIELVLEEALEDITSNLGLNLFKARLKYFRVTEEQRTKVIRENQESLALVKQLSTQIEKHKTQLSSRLHAESETLGKLKDEYEDRIYEDDIKYRYIDRWERARCAQNKVDVDKKEEYLTNLVREYYNNTLRENRIHAEIEAYLTEMEFTNQNDIERWMEKYDRDLDTKEIDIQFMKEKRDEQMSNLENLSKVYAEHKRELEEYLIERDARRRREETEAKMNLAATKIQAWWRGIMFRKGLGPHKKKKGKKGKGNGKKK